MKRLLKVKNKNAIIDQALK